MSIEELREVMDPLVMSDAEVDDCRELLRQGRKDTAMIKYPIARLAATVLYNMNRTDPA